MQATNAVEVLPVGDVDVNETRSNFKPGKIVAIHLSKAEFA